MALLGLLLVREHSLGLVVLGRLVVSLMLEPPRVLFPVSMPRGLPTFFLMLIHLLMEPLQVLEPKRQVWEQPVLRPPLPG